MTSARRFHGPLHSSLYPMEPHTGLRLPPPRVTTAIVVINAVAYGITSLEKGFVQISNRWLNWGAYVPALAMEPGQAYRILTSMFLHADLFHIFFNMMYLYFFGKSVEYVLGGRRFLALYLASGLVAQFFHTAFIPVEGALSAVVPAIGASGAISGVLGAYLLLFPGSRLSMCFFYFFFPVCVTLNAAAYLVFWFVSQVLYGYLGASLGVAVFAHAGGFLGGLALLPYVLDEERHRLFRAISAPQRAFRYIYLGRSSLGSLSKLVLASAVVAVMAGGAYSALAAGSMAADVKVLAFKVEYVVFCPPSGAACGSGLDEELVIMGIGGQGVDLLTQITTDGVRVVFNRLHAAGLIYDAARRDVTVVVNRSMLRRVLGVPVKMAIRMKAKYDSQGAIEEASGRIRTDVLACGRMGCVVSGEGEYTFAVRQELGGERFAGVSNLVSLLSLVSIAVSLLALDALIRKSGYLGIVV